MRTNHRRQIEILPTAQLVALIERAFALLEEELPIPGSYGETETPDENFKMAREMFRFAMMAAGMNQDLALLAHLDDIVGELTRWQDDRLSAMDAVAEAVSLIVQNPEISPAAARKLATHAAADVREAVAEGLTPTVPAQRAVLFELAQDSVPAVQQAAKVTLEPTGELPWWLGIFTRDPVEIVTPDELAPHKAALEGLAALMAKPWYSKERTASGAASRALATLPPALRADAAWCAVRNASADDLRDPSWVTELFATDEGVARFLDRVDAWDEHVMDAHRITQVALPAAPTAARRAVVAGLIDRLLALMDGGHDNTAMASYTLKGYLKQAWVTGDDPTSVLERLVAFETELPPEHLDTRDDAAAIVFEHTAAVPAATWERIAEARRRGYPGTWHALARVLDGALCAAPRALLRRAAEDALASESRDDRTWAIHRLIGEAFDPAIDGSKRRLLDRCLRDARLRPAVLADGDLVVAALPLLRARLRKGRLRYASALRTLQAIDEAYGGIAAVRPRPDKDTRAEKRERRKLAQSVVRTKRFRGPITPEEWRAYRAERDPRLQRRAADWHSALAALPAGDGWQPEDAALREMFEARMRDPASWHHREVMPLMGGLMAFRDPGVLPRIDAVIAVMPERARPMFGYLREEFQKALGIKPTLVVPAAPEATAKPAADDDWGDE